MTSTDKTRTALAVLGKPDKTFAYHMGALSIPYLALSFREMDLIESIPLEAPAGLDDEDLSDFLREKRARESECAYHLLRRRLGDRAPQSQEEVHEILNADLVWAWFRSLWAGEKGEAVGTPAEPQPNG